MKICFRLLGVILMLIPAVSFAQLRMGLLGGPHSASVKESNQIADWDARVKPGYSPRSGFHIGMTVEIPLDNNARWFLHPSLDYQTKGRKFFQRYDSAYALLTDTITASNTLAVNYIEIPFLLTHKFPLGKKSNFIVSAGPYASFFYNGKQSHETRLFNTNGFKKEENKLEVGNAENKIKTLDFGLYGRAGFEIGSVLLTGFFSQAMSSFYSAPYEGSFKHKVVGASLGFWLNRPAVSIVSRDRDNDGVEDKEDLCPQTPGSALTKGCPDADGDGIADIEDSCPTLPGLVKYKGCPIPDSDNDGIDDENDKCPGIAGSKNYGGCPVPDTDGDGINDDNDSCPDKPGVLDYKGCPVPDRDGDGINDLEDKCPDLAGTKADNGCPPIKRETVEKVNYAAKSIFFKVNSDELTVGSFAALDDIVEVLNAYPAAKMEIHGHTDKSGKAETNFVLSEKRAQSVRKYLASKGIDENRLIARGFGDELPLETNNTAAGRAKNRRVELKLQN